MADPSTRVLRWAYRCFVHSRRKRRLPVRDPPRSANNGRRFYKRASDSRSRLSSGRHRDSRPTLPSSVGHQSHGIVYVLQDMFLASRPKFVAIAYSILRNSEDADDAVQDPLLSPYFHLPIFPVPCPSTT